MGMHVEVTWNERDVKRWKDSALMKEIVRGLRNGGDRGGRRMVKDTVGYIKGRKRLSSAFIRGQIFLERPARGAVLEDLVWKVRVSGKPVSLSQYPYRQTKTGVTVRVNTGKATKLPGAFIASFGSGHVGVFLRRGKKRLPIKELYSSKLTEVLRDDGAVDGIFVPAREEMSAAFDKAVGDFAKGG